MAAGAALILLRLIKPRRTAAIAAMLLLGPVVWALSYMALEGIPKPLAGDAGPAWFEDEVGILVTGIFWLAVGLAQLRCAAPEAVRRSGLSRVRGGACILGAAPRKLPPATRASRRADARGAGSA